MMISRGVGEPITFVVVFLILVLDPYEGCNSSTKLLLIIIIMGVHVLNYHYISFPVSAIPSPSSFPSCSSVHMIYIQRDH